LITLDNGFDHTKPSTFGPGGLLELSDAIDVIARRAQHGDLAAIGVTGKPFVFTVGADLKSVSLIESWAARVLNGEIAVERAPVPGNSAADCELRHLVHLRGEADLVLDGRPGRGEAVSGDLAEQLRIRRVELGELLSGRLPCTALSRFWHRATSRDGDGRLLLLDASNAGALVGLRLDAQRPFALIAVSRPGRRG